MYQGEPILAVAAVDELTAADAIEKIQIEFEPLPFVVDPLVSLRPGGPNARTKGNVLEYRPPARPAATGRWRPRAASTASRDPELKWTEAEFADAKEGRLPMGKATDEWSYGDLDAGFKKAALVLDETFVTPNTSHQTLETRTAMAYWQNGKVYVSTGRRRARSQTVARSGAMASASIPTNVVRHQRVHRRRIRQQDHRRDLAGHSGAPLEESERAGDDAHQPRGRALHRRARVPACTAG